METCKIVIPCPNGRKHRSYRRQMNVSVDSKIFKLFNEKMVERKEENKSDLIEYLMQCWIYSYDGECDPVCPFYEVEKEDGKDS